MKNERIRALEQLARAFRPPAETLDACDSDADPAMGQVWSTHGSPQFPNSGPLPDFKEPYLVVIVQADVADVTGHTLHHVAPLLYETHMAGPTDVLLPKEIFGHRKAMAIGSTVTILRDSLKRCLGRLPAPWPERIPELLAQCDADTGIEMAGVHTGFEYLDEQDLRFQFHEELTDNLGYLQAPAIAWAEECGLLVAPDEAEIPAERISLLAQLNEFLFAPFDSVPFQPVALKASEASATRPLQSHTCESDDRLVIQISEAEKPAHCAIEVLHDPEKALEGAEVLDRYGRVLGVIKNRVAYFELESLEGARIALRSQDGRLRSFRRVCSADE